MDLRNVECSIWTALLAVFYSIHLHNFGTQYHIYNVNWLRKVKHFVFIIIMIVLVVIVVVVFVVVARISIRKPEQKNLNHWIVYHLLFTRFHFAFLLIGIVCVLLIYFLRIVYISLVCFFSSLLCELKSKISPNEEMKWNKS